MTNRNLERFNETIQSMLMKWSKVQISLFSTMVLECFKENQCEIASNSDGNEKPKQSTSTKNEILKG